MKRIDVYKHDLNMIKVALDCYMGDDLKEDSNLSRPVKEALKDFEDLLSLLDNNNLSIKSKLDHIQDVFDNLYETNKEGKIIESEINDEIGLAEEDFIDIKMAYSYRLADTYLINELKEITGTSGENELKNHIKELVANRR